MHLKNSQKKTKIAQEWLWTLECEMPLWFWIRWLSKQFPRHIEYFCTVSPASVGDGWTYRKISTPVVQRAFTITFFLGAIPYPCTSLIVGGRVGGIAAVHEVSVDNCYVSVMQSKFSNRFFLTVLRNIEAISMIRFRKEPRNLNIT